MTYVYFYTARYTLAGNTVEYSGLLSTDFKVVTQEAFADIINIISEKLPKYKCVVTSLSFLHAVENVETL